MLVRVPCLPYARVIHCKIYFITLRRPHQNDKLCCTLLNPVQLVIHRHCTVHRQVSSVDYVSIYERLIAPNPSSLYAVSGTGSAPADVSDSAPASPRSRAASDRRTLWPRRMVSRCDPTTRLAALDAERIPDRKSTSRCVMTTLHLGRDDRGKENAVSPP